MQHEYVREGIITRICYLLVYYIIIIILDSHIQTPSDNNSFPSSSPF